MPIPIAELFGYIASFFVAISLLMNSFLLLRVLNLIGAVAFVVYGVLIGSIPIVITNSFITAIDVWYLVRMLRPDLNGIRYIPVGAEKRHQLDDFVALNLEDMISFFPDFRVERLDDLFVNGGTAFLAIRDLDVIGFALAEPVPAAELTRDAELRDLYKTINRDLYPERSLLVPVDYIRRKYRGFGLFRRLYRAIEEHSEGQVEFLLATIPLNARTHRRFLEKTAYKTVRETQNWALMVKDLRAES